MAVDSEEHVLIEIVGWVYFAAWSISFYGQIYENFIHKRYTSHNKVLKE